MANSGFVKDLQYYKFCSYGFLKNLRFFEPFLILYLNTKGISFLQIGTLYAIREIVRNIFEIPSGIMADGVGKRKSLIIAFAVYIFSFGIFYISTSYWLFAGAMFFYGFAEAFRTGSHKALIYTYLRTKGWTEHKIDYYGHTRASSQLGSAISAIIAAFIVFTSSDYSKVFLFSMIPYVLDLFLMMSYPKYLDGILTKVTMKSLGEIFSKIVKDVFVNMKNSDARRSIINMSIYDGYYGAIKDFLQPVLKTLALSLPIFLYLNDNKRTAVVVGLVYFIIYMISSYASRHSSGFSKYFSSNSKAMNITFVSGLFFGLLSGIFFHFNIAIVSIVFYLLIYVNQNLRKPINVSYVSEKFSEEVLATTLSTASQVETVFSAIIIVLIGFFADKFGVGISLAVVSGLLLLLFPLMKVKNK